MSSSTWLSSVATDTMGLTAAAQSAASSRATYAQYALAQATTAMSDNNMEKAITALKQAVTLDSSNTTAYNYLGKIYLSQDNTEEAIKAYKELVRIQSNVNTKDTSSSAPTQEAAIISLGNAYLQDKQYTNAETQFKKAASLSPSDPVPVYTLGQMYLSQDRLTEAETQLKKAQELSSNDANAYYALGTLYNKQENYMEAATSLQKALQLKSSFPDANYELGVAYNALNYTEGVEEQLTALKSSDYTLYTDLLSITKPQITGIDTYHPMNTFNAGLGPNTPLWVVNTSLLAPNSTTELTTVIQFSKDMDYESITNIANWSITRGNSTSSGYYNNTMPVSSKDAIFSSIPTVVYYDDANQEAIVTFRLTQNSNGDAIIDSKHLVFTFNGKDASGQAMDLTSNAIDGAAEAPFGTIDTYA